MHMKSVMILHVKDIKRCCLFQVTPLSSQWTTVILSPNSLSETQNSLMRIFATSSQDNEPLFQIVTSKMVPKPSLLSTDGR